MIEATDEINRGQVAEAAGAAADEPATSSAAATWFALTGDRPTTAQRRALYRLGYSRPLVRRFDRVQAAQAIAAGLTLRDEMGDLPTRDRQAR